MINKQLKENRIYKAREIDAKNAKKGDIKKKLKRRK